jgi:hypothetical protein
MDIHPIQLGIAPLTVVEFLDSANNQKMNPILLAD